MLFPGYPPPGSHSRVEKWIDISFPLNQIKDNLVQWEEFLQESDMCSNSSLATLDLTLKSSYICLHLVCEMGELMPTGVIGLIDLSIPPQSVPGKYQILSRLLLPTSTQRRVRVCACARTCAHRCTHTCSFPGEENEWSLRDEMTCSLVTPWSVTVPSIQWRRCI